MWLYITAWAVKTAVQFMHFNFKMHAVNAICCFELAWSMQFGFSSKPHKTEVRFYAFHAVYAIL